jgi:Recombination endonuclease VII
MDNSEYQRNDFKLKEWGMTATLGRFYDVMKIMSWTPAQSEAGRS